MSLKRTLQSLKISMLLGGVVGLGFGFGCVITLVEPCDSGSHNKINDDGQCECLIGYEWCNPDDPMNLDCCDSDPDVGNDDVVDTSTTNGTTDTTTDTDDTVGTTDSTDTTTGDDTTDTGTLPPDSCTADEEGFYWCTHDDAMGPQGSQFFICQGGVWVESNGFMDESCMFDGYDFAYGCVDNGTEIVFECGDGAGTACNNDDPAFCVDGDVIGYCDFGKETWESCQTFCETVGIDGVTYEYGECDPNDPVACYCCDSIDPDCPING